MPKEFLGVQPETVDLSRERERRKVEKMEKLLVLTNGVFDALHGPEMRAMSQESPELVEVRAAAWKKTRELSKFVRELIGVSDEEWWEFVRGDVKGVETPRG